MKSCILLTHQFFLEHQKKDKNVKLFGSSARWGENWKPKVFEYCLNHYRKNNPKSLIIVTGHGKIPNKNIFDKADIVDWNEKIIEGEIGKGHPVCVKKGLEIAKENKIDFVCKSRLDTINLKKNIADYCQKLLSDNNKTLLNTWYSKTNYSLMDLFNFGNVEDLINIYDNKNWKKKEFINKDGTYPVAKNYIELVLKKELQDTKIFNLEFWESCLQKKFYFASPKELGWIDIRKNNFIANKHIKVEEMKKYYWEHKCPL